MSSSIFVSGIPRSLTVSAVDEFLRTTFPLLTSLTVLHDGQLEQHKGCAYVHFESADIAAVSASSVTVPFVVDHCTLRMRILATECLQDAVADASERASDMRCADVDDRAELIESHTSCQGAHADAADIVVTATVNNSPSCVNPTGNRTTNDRVAQLTQLWERLPLPACCLASPYALCAYHIHSSVDHRRSNANDLPTTGDVCHSAHCFTTLYSYRRHRSTRSNSHNDGCNSDNSSRNLAKNCTSSSPTHMESDALVCIDVVLFGDKDAHEKAVCCAMCHFARCGPPSLLQVMQPCYDWVRHLADVVEKDDAGEGNSYELDGSTDAVRSCTAASSVRPEDVCRRLRKVCDADTTEYRVSKRPRSLQRRELSDRADCDMQSKLTPLTPAQVLDEVRELLEGHGRIAVKDRKGVISLLRVPTYLPAVDNTV